MDNLEEMDKLLEMYNLPKLNQEERQNVNRPITANEIQAVIKTKKQNKTKQKTLSKQKSWTNVFSSEFYQTFTKELTSIFLKLLENIQRWENSQAYLARPALS